MEQLRDGRDRDPGKAVHEARKALKRSRAVVRLARDELGDDVYRRENSAFRDAGRRLSGARDSEVIVQTLEALCARYRRELPPHKVEGLHAQLEAERRTATERLQHDAAAIDESLQELQAARTRVSAWVLEHDDLEALVPGVERIYRRGQRSLADAKADPADEHLHDCASAPRTCGIRPRSCARSLPSA
jgi:CHAD domain-containing protein